ncbi:MAG: DUF368 domain-containing protein [Clostridia bacterium]|nr:DUF368 domain-containing protein [Clostridia bacterium]
MLLKSLILAVQGAIVGTGAILPGVSGGVLLVAFGIYEPMMAMISHPGKTVKIYYKMFIPFVIGWLLGFTLLANAVEVMFQACAPVALMLFFGLICGTLPELIKNSERSDAKMSWTPFVVTLSLAYFLFCLLERGRTAEVHTNMMSFVLCGLIWGLSLLIPGLSSSSVLLYMGLYEPMTAGIASLDFSVIVPLLLGLGISVAALARMINSLYEKHYAVVSRLILGFVIASSLKIVPVEFDSAKTLVLALVCFAAGFVLARYMDCAKNKQKKG